MVFLRDKSSIEVIRKTASTTVHSVHGPNRQMFSKRLRMKQSRLQRTPRGTPIRGSACVAWILGELAKPLNPAARPPTICRKIGEAKSLELLRRLEQGEAVKDLAAEYGVSAWTVWHLQRAR